MKVRTGEKNRLFRSVFSLSITFFARAQISCRKDNEALVLHFEGIHSTKNISKESKIDFSANDSMTFTKEGEEE